GFQAPRLTIPSLNLGVFLFGPAFAAQTVDTPRLAIGDVIGTPTPDLVLSLGPGNNNLPFVVVFDGDQVFFQAVADPVLKFLAYAPAFRGGVFVGVGNIEGGAKSQIITGADAGAGPHVEVWDIGPGNTPILTRSFFAFSPLFRGGARVAAGDYN